MKILSNALVGLMVIIGVGCGKVPKSTPQPETSFSGEFTSFSVQLLGDSGSALGKAYVGFQFEVQGNTLGAGSFDVYDCGDVKCSQKFFAYRFHCDFSTSTCVILNNLGVVVDKGVRSPTGDVYSAEAADLSLVGVNYCGSSSTFKYCNYVSVIDPELRPDSHYDQYYAAQFVPTSGPKSGFKTFHLQRRP